MNSRALLAGTLIALGLVGLAEEGRAARVVSGTLRHQGRARTFRVLVPKGHRKESASPLVLALHGGGGTAEALDRMTTHQFAREADARGWLVVFPQGVAKGWNDGRPLKSLRDRRRRGVDDVAFLGALI